MALKDLTREAVLAAVQECDDLGPEVFLSRYGFGPARDYFLLLNGRRYDSKAVVGVAHKFAVPAEGPLHLPISVVGKRRSYGCSNAWDSR
jgi:5-methylcytosine-specific restriction protein A